MTESEYFGQYPSEEKGIDVDEIRKTIHNEFIEDLAIAASIASTFPPDWQLQILLNIMEDI